jgi:hypothetical protein
LSVFLLPSGLLVWKIWDSLSLHARGMILAAYGVILPFSQLIPALRTRELPKTGVRAQDTVVGAERDISEEPQVVPAADDFAGASGSLQPVTQEPVTQEPVPEVRPAAPKVATGRIGDTLTVSDQSAAPSWRSPSPG